MAKGPHGPLEVWAAGASICFALPMPCAAIALPMHCSAHGGVCVVHEGPERTGIRSTRGQQVRWCMPPPQTPIDWTRNA